MDTTLTRRATVLTTPIGHIVLTPTHVDTRFVSDMLEAAGVVSLDFGWSYREGFFGEELYASEALVAEVLRDHGWTVTEAEEHVGMCGTSIDLSVDDLALFARDYDKSAGL